MITKRALLVAMVGGILLLGLLYGVLGGAITPPTERTIAPRAVVLKPVRRILILGTSLTSRGDWVATLERRLRDCALGVTVERLARPGASSRWGLTALRERLAKDVPDFLVIEFSGNDASLKNGFPLPISRMLHRQMISEARAAGTIVVLATMSPAWRRNAWERPGQRRYHALYRDLARESDVGLIDTIPDWDTLSTSRRAVLVPDNLHPTFEAMNTITVPAFEEALRPFVCAP